MITERRQFKVDTLLIANIAEIRRVRITVEPALANELSAEMPGIISLEEDEIDTQKVRVFLADLDPLYSTPEAAIDDLNAHLYQLVAKPMENALEAALHETVDGGDTNLPQPIPTEV